MSLVAKLFGRPADCPMCGTPGAKVGFFSDPKCVNFACRFYDAAQVEERETQRMPAPRQIRPPTPPAEFLRLITFEYVNFRREVKTFTGDPTSIRARGTRLSVRVAPTGLRINLGRDRITNLDAIKSALPAAYPDFSNPLTVQYTNYQGQQKTFTADPGSVRDLGGHLSMCVEPTGARIALKRHYISNLALVEEALGQH